MSNQLKLSILLDSNNKALISGLRESGVEIGNFENKSESAGRAVNHVNKEVSGLSSAAGVLSGALAAISLGTLTKEAYEGIDSLQKYRAQLKTVAGDWRGAERELNRLIDIARETPFTLEQSVEGFAKLTNLGLNPSKEAMVSYGNTASAMGKDLMQMVEAVADASVGEFERLKEFGIKASSEGDRVKFIFRGTTTEIGKNANEIQNYLINIGKTDFATSMSDQMSRVSSQASNLGISINLLWGALDKEGLGTAFGDVIGATTVK